MSLMSWLSSPRRSAARKKIQSGLQFMKLNGLFGGDPAKGAQAVEDFSASRFSKTLTDNMSATVLAVSWLVVFVSASGAPRDYLLPFANVGLSLLRVATAPGSELASWEQNIAQRALDELLLFIELSPIDFSINSKERAT